ncbi:MAG: TetR family transcriptional regulator C-terminal domain-containing protein [Selenomonadaceae bacterium]|nr:TetR family transcriptional regulator C-terminal domain-containing protein [Selenomonadaceae bacterium]
MEDGFKYFLDNREFLKNLINLKSGPCSFTGYVAHFNLKIFSDYIKRVNHLETLPPDIEIFLRVYCYGIMCTFGEMITRPMPVSEKEFVELIEKSVPEPLKKYLYKN